MANVDEEESEYDSIFTTLLENEKKGQQGHTEISKPEMFEEEKRYQTSDFLRDIKDNLKKENRGPTQRTEVKAVPASQSQSQEPKFVEKNINTGLPGKKKDELKDETQDKRSEKVNNVVKEPIKKTPINPSLNEANLSQEKDRNELFAVLPSIQEKKDRSFTKKQVQPDNTLGISNLESEEDFLSIERRLGYLFNEIEKSMQETHYLQSAVGDFEKEVETYTPITGDEKIIATGNLIREKLKTIIDKQFVVDEVLDDLIRLSKLINNRINDLDVIEAGLNQRKIALNQKDVLFVEGRDRRTTDAEVEILPEEVVLENIDSEFIVAEGDYETIRKYLTKDSEK